MKRRTFLSVAAASCAGAAVPQPRFVFPSKPLDRLAVASYPFRAFIDSPGNRDRDPGKPGMDLVEFGRRAQREWRVHNIEPLNTHFGATDAESLRRLREELRKAGIGVANVAADLPGSLYDPDDTERAKAVERRKEWIDIAGAIGSPGVRVNDPATKRSGPDLGRAVDSCRKLAAYAGERGVVVSLENDNLVSEDALFIARIVDQVQSPYLRALPDFCNSMQSGDEKFGYEALAALFPRAWSICHVKDSEPGPDHRVFRVDLGKAFATLKASSFRGFCSMEWEGEGDPFRGTGALIDQSLLYI